MLGKILSSIGDKELRSAADEKRLMCPACGETYTGVTGALDDIITCPACAYDASGYEWMERSRDGLKNQWAGTAPADTKIQYRQTGTTRTWEIPPVGNSTVMFIFAIIWLSITFLITVSSAISLMRDTSSDGSWISGLLILLACWCVGLGVLGFALHAWNARHILSIDDQQITLTRDLLGRRKSKSIPLDQIQFIHQTVFYTRNYNPVYGIEIKSRSVKLRFGSGLTADEKAWLIAEIKHACDGKQPTLASFYAPALVSRGAALPSATGTVPDSAGQVSHGPAYQGALQPFKVEVPRTMAMLVVSIIMVILMIIVFSIWPERRGFFDFGLLPITEPEFIFFLFAFVFMIGQLIYWLVQLSKKITLEGNGAELVLRTTRFGRTLREQRFPYHQVRGLRTVFSGPFNNEEQSYRLELLAGSKSHTLAKSLRGNTCTEIITAVHRGLGMDRG